MEVLFENKDIADSKKGKGSFPMFPDKLKDESNNYKQPITLIFLKKTILVGVVMNIPVKKKVFSP
ncbi:MAG: hypothetical protein LBE18_03380 [Planctomycetaceae bacterium]|jgi:hypothetical protein|nr:hypothetical protein [Planctomycetaceae bacterium]